jgi:hypothetical protein
MDLNLKSFFSAHVVKNELSEIRNCIHDALNFKKTENIVRYLLYLLFIISALLRFYYVFFCTNYPNYLVSDMANYWEGAERHFSGNIFDMAQFVIWPPFFSRVLAFIFEILAFLGLFQFKLQIVLSFFIILSSLSVLCIFSITRQIIKNNWFSLLAATLYAFYFPLIYTNCCVLSENFAIPFAIFAIWFLFRGSNLNIVLAGISLALASGVRPGNAILGFPFVLFLFFTSAGFLKRFIRPLIFSLSFFALVFTIMIENGHISRQSMKQLSASGAITFYLNMTKLHRVDFIHGGYTWVLVPPSTVNNEENGQKTLDFFPFESKKLKELGMQLIKEDPKILLRNFSNFKDLFFGVLFPSMGDAGAFNFFYTPFKYILFFMFLLSLLGWIAFRTEYIDHLKLSLIISILLLGFLTFYLFNSEYRYIFSIAFAIHILFIVAIYVIIKEFKKSGKLVLISAVVILILFISGFAIRKLPSCPVKMTLSQDKNVVYDLYQSRNPALQKTIYIDRLDFPFNSGFTHYRIGDIGFQENFFADFQTSLDVRESGNYDFTIYSDDGFDFTIDSLKAMSENSCRSFKEPVYFTTFLSEGSHSIRISYFQASNGAGIVALYKKSKDNAVVYRIGENSRYFKFQKPH